MNQEQIKTLIDALAASELSELEYSENGCTLRLVKKPARAAVRDATAMAADDVVDMPLDAPSEAPPPAAHAAECLAPLYGVIHLQSSPGEPPFIAPGQSVTAGQTLCVIEAMKVFNEVRAERDGVVQTVLVESGQEVEAGQPLFRFG